jgi:hypothetical protein
VNVNNIHKREAIMPIVAKLDEWGQPAWIGLLILAFFISWPVAFAFTAFLIWSGRMGCWRGGGVSRWQGVADRMGPAQGWWQPRSSGNRAFDDYRADTLRRLEEEQQEFREFLERLRAAKDKSEFDQFMADRRNRSGGAPQPTQS